MIRRKGNDDDGYISYFNIDHPNKIIVGGKLDVHKWISRLPKAKAGWTPSKYKLMGPFNPLNKQLEYDYPKTGEITKWNVQPYNKVDEIAAKPDICYDMGKTNKNDCDRQLRPLDEIPGKMPKWGQTARFLINTKQKLALGYKKKPKNVRRQR